MGIIKSTRRKNGNGLHLDKIHKMQKGLFDAKI